MQWEVLAMLSVPDVLVPTLLDVAGFAEVDLLLTLLVIR